VHPNGPGKPYGVKPMLALPDPTTPGGHFMRFWGKAKGASFEEAETQAHRSVLSKLKVCTKEIVKQYFQDICSCGYFMRFWGKAKGESFEDAESQAYRSVLSKLKVSHRLRARVKAGVDRLGRRLSRLSPGGGADAPHQCISVFRRIEGS
jgi:hypothetical protein